MNTRVSWGRNAQRGDEHAAQERLRRTGSGGSTVGNDEQDCISAVHQPIFACTARHSPTFSFGYR